MKIDFLGQGYNTNINTSVAQALIDALSDESYHTFKCLVAFASQSGVSGLTNHILKSKAHIKNFRIIIGVDQYATSKEALEGVLEWKVDAFVYYSTQRNIFHPKIYLFEGVNDILAIIGSNNLTQMGLVQNIEGAVKIKFKRDEIEGERLINQITNYFTPLLTNNAPNLKALSVDLINNLSLSGIITSEQQRRNLYNKINPLSENINDLKTNKFLDVSVLFPRTSLQKLPESFKPKRTGRNKITKSNLEIESLPNINSDDWDYSSNNQVLIVEIGGPSRWKQISFAKGNFESFFEISTKVGTSGQINLRYINDNGNIEDQIEISISAKVKKSRNFNLEPLKVRESAITYTNKNRPIIFFVKINSDNFLYHFESIGSELYTQLQRILPIKTSNKLRRLTIRLDELQQKCKSFNLD